MTIYTEDMRREVRRIPKIENFQLDIVEFDMIDPPIILLRFYSDEWYRMTELQLGRSLEYLAKVKQKIEEYGVRVSLDPCIRSK